MNVHVPDWCKTCDRATEPAYIVHSNGKAWCQRCGNWLEDEGEKVNDSITSIRMQSYPVGGIPPNPWKDGQDRGCDLGSSEGSLRERGSVDQSEDGGSKHPAGLSRALDLLKDASEVIQNREPLYGSAERHWKATAACFQAYLERRGWKAPQKEDGVGALAAEDIGMFFILDKVMRQGNRAKRDNLLDVCGYAACAQRVIESKEPA